MEVHGRWRVLVWEGEVERWGGRAAHTAKCAAVGPTTIRQWMRKILRGCEVARANSARWVATLDKAERRFATADPSRLHESHRMLLDRLTAAILCGACLLLGPHARADESIDYLRDVKPIFEERCFACHGVLKQSGSLRLDTAEHMKTGGDSGPAIVPGDPDDSWLVQLITGEAGYRMPPDGEGAALSADEIDRIRRWIAAGALAPGDEKPQQDPREYWSYRSIQRPPIPEVSRRDWVRTPIDAFIAEQHETRQLEPRPPADRAVLLRRVYLDLVGVPPTVDELRRFLTDDSPRAYEDVVDRLLASPQYGERWGRHWMDVWRYSDWYGYRATNDLRYGQRHSWRWRDWIVESLNADKGYDQMVLEMIAGDELAPGDPDVIRATGFLGRNWYRLDRNVWMFDVVEHTAQAFLGVTMRCARCHDHKFDPLTHREYFEFRAYFEPHGVRTDPLGARPADDFGISLVYDKDPALPTYIFARGDGRFPIEDEALAPGVPEALAPGDPEIEPVTLHWQAAFPSLRPSVLAELRAAAEQKLEASRKMDDSDPRKALVLAAAEQERATLEARIVADQARAESPESPAAQQLAHTAAAAERDLVLKLAELALQDAEASLAAAKAAENPDTAAREKAIAGEQMKRDVAAQQLEAARAALASNDAKYTPLGPEYPRTSTGRRLALARWMVDPRNPRTARVAVNHIWLRHFGEGIVPTAANFGLNGRAPSHPELLDWLAAEFIDSGWKMKALHRLIVTSSVYRMASTEGVSAENLKRDPDNRFLWRMNSRRAEAEVVRDSLLAVAGELDLQIGGPELPESEGMTSRRRTLYFRTTPNDKMQMLEVFDHANPNECYRRQVSVVPQQALAMTNSPLALNSARRLAAQLTQRLATESNADFTEADWIRCAFEHALSRLPTDAELAACERFLERHRQLVEQDGQHLYPAIRVEVTAASEDPRQHARENLLHVLLNHNDFVTIR